MLDITPQDILKFKKCKENLYRCKYVGIESCIGCEYDLSREKIEYIRQQ